MDGAMALTSLSTRPRLCVRDGPQTSPWRDGCQLSALRHLWFVDFVLRQFGYFPRRE